MSNSSDNYGLSAAFERAIAAHCCANPNFFGRVGRNINIDLLVDDAAKLAINAAQAIDRDLGRGPSSSLSVVQRLRRWMNEGRTTFGEMRSVGELLEDADETDLPPPDEVLNELTPVLQKRAQQDAVRMAIRGHSKGESLDDVVVALQKASRIGVCDSSQGVRIGSESFEEIKRLRRIQRLPTGVPELDLQLNGGLARSALGVVVGGAGDGKSMFLSHVASECLYNGLSCLYATLEISEGEVLARIKSNLTAVPIDAIVSETAMDIAKERLEALSNREFDGRPGLGLGIVKSFTAHVTTVSDISEWVDSCEQAEGRRIDVVFVDYADRLGAPKEKSDYSAMKIVYEELRQVSERKKNFLWTASQATRGKKDRKRMDLNHVADSMHKGRIADLVITLNVDGEEGEEISFYIAKHRTGRSRISVGPLLHDFANGQIVPASRDIP